MHEKFPPEALQGCSFEEFVEQYVRFREWLRGVSRSHVGREFRTLVRVRLEVLDDTAAAGAKDSAAAAAGAKSSHWASPAVIKEAKDFTFIPREGATVTSVMHGRCRVLEVETRVCNTRLMRFVMATGIMEIQCRRIWHAVRAYHRCALLSVPSESIAETVGSVLRDAATKAAGRPKPVDVFAAPGPPMSAFGGCCRPPAGGIAWATSTCRPLSASGGIALVSLP